MFSIRSPAASPHVTQKAPLRCGAEVQCGHCYLSLLAQEDEECGVRQGVGFRAIGQLDDPDPVTSALVVEIC
jgi:hypothetical protein